MPAHSAYRGRFAPSPTGPLHFGSLLAAFGSWLFARQAEGSWLVRIEDLDPPRELAGAAEEQLRTLAAFGMTPDEPVVRQSERYPLYEDALRKLEASGLVFACHCSRSELSATAGVHHACVSAGKRPDPALRLRIGPNTQVGFDDQVCGDLRQDLHRGAGDPVIRRSDGLWAYLLAVVVDDAAQGITHVVRGGDLLDSTPVQIHLQRQLGSQTPRYAHLPLVLGEDGRKLSKSSSALPVDPADAVPGLRAAWQALGQAATDIEQAGDVPALLERAVANFDASRIPAGRDIALAALHNGNLTGPD